MRRKPREIRLDESTTVQAIETQVGQQEPLSVRYCVGPRATLVAVDGETATMLFPNGSRLENVLVGDLVDDSGYWKR